MVTFHSSFSMLQMNDKRLRQERVPRFVSSRYRHLPIEIFGRAKLSRPSTSHFHLLCLRSSLFHLLPGFPDTLLYSTTLLSAYNLVLSSSKNDTARMGVLVVQISYFSIKLITLVVGTRSQAENLQLRRVSPHLLLYLTRRIHTNPTHSILRPRKMYHHF